MEPAGVLLVVSVLLVVAFVLLTISLMRLRGTARELEGEFELIRFVFLDEALRETFATALSS